MKLLFFIIIASLASHSFSQSYGHIREKLEKIALESHALRAQVMPTLKTFGVTSPEMGRLNTQIKQFDSAAFVYVSHILDTHGWLGKDKIGKTANHTLFLVVQHADAAARKRYFPLLAASAEKGKSERSAVATMKDRMLVEAGKKQLYGTQSHLVEGVLTLHPMKDPERVNQRRRKMGLKKL